MQNIAARNSLSAYIAIVALLVCSRGVAIGALQSLDMNKVPNQGQRDQRVKVLDENEQPVQNVVVRPELLSVEQGYVAWPTDVLGKPPQVKTDEFGIASLPCPTHLEQSPVESIVWTTNHPRFVSYRRSHFSKDDPAILKLKTGLRIAATAIDGTTGRNIRSNLTAITSFDANWDLSKKGLLYSNTVGLKEGILRVVCFEKGLPTLFSEEIRIAPGNMDRILLKDVELWKGIRVQGRIDDAIERPIKSGRVFASVCSKISDNEISSRDQSWRWKDEAEIKADGSFVFESVPDGVPLQMTAVCDGWYSDKPSLEDCIDALPHIGREKIRKAIDGFDICPQVAKVNGDMDDVHLTMKRSGTLEVHVVDDKGNAIKGAEVEVVPLHGWFDFVGKAEFTERGTVATRDSATSDKFLTKNESVAYRSYIGKSDSKGWVKLGNIPATQLFVSVRHKSFELPKDRHLNIRKRIFVLLKRNGKITLTLNAKRKTPTPDE